MQIYWAHALRFEFAVDLQLYFLGTFKAVDFSPLQSGFKVWVAFECLLVWNVDRLSHRLIRTQTRVGIKRELHWMQIADHISDGLLE